MQHARERTHARRDVDTARLDAEALHEAGDLTRTAADVGHRRRRSGLRGAHIVGERAQQRAVEWLGVELVEIARRICVGDRVVAAPFVHAMR